MGVLGLLDRIRQDWRQREPALNTDVMVTFITLARAQDLLGRSVRATAALADLTNPSRDLLFTLYRSAPEDGLPAGEIAALLAVSPASVTNHTDQLEARGLLSRTLDPQDRRSWRIRLTEQGRVLVRAHLPQHLAHEEDLLSGLTEQEVEQLEKLLRKLIAHGESMGLR